MALPKCPDNGLVIFDDFKPEEVKRLAELIATDEYRALAASETNYFLAAWLMERLGRPAIDVAWMVLQASWEADGQPELKKRYQSLYVEKIRALLKEDGLTWLAMQGRAVNGLRELERFDEAKALLASLDLSPLDVPVPEEKKGAATPGGRGHQVLNYDEIEEARNKRGFLDYFSGLAKLVELRDSRSEPLRMIPARDAAERCKKGRLSEDDRTYCGSAEMRALARKEG